MSSGVAHGNISELGAGKVDGWANQQTERGRRGKLYISLGMKEGTRRERSTQKVLTKEITEKGGNVIQAENS